MYQKSPSFEYVNNRVKTALNGISLRLSIQLNTLIRNIPQSQFDVLISFHKYDFENDASFDDITKDMNFCRVQREMYSKAFSKILRRKDIYPCVSDNTY